MRLTALLLCLAAMMLAAAPLSARQCKYRELQSKLDEKVTMTAKIDMVEPEENDPKAVFITLDNTRGRPLLHLPHRRSQVGAG